MVDMEHGCKMEKTLWIWHSFTTRNNLAYSSQIHLQQMWKNREHKRLNTLHTTINSQVSPLTVWISYQIKYSECWCSYYNKNGKCVKRKKWKLPDYKVKQGVAALAKNITHHKWKTMIFFFSWPLPVLLTHILTCYSRSSRFNGIHRMRNRRFSL